MEDYWPEQPVQDWLDRFSPRLETEFSDYMATNPCDWRSFRSRLVDYFPHLYWRYFKLYASHPEFNYYLEDLILTCARSWISRNQVLKELDNAREDDPLWFQSNQMLGGVCYVDLFAGNLKSLRAKIPYFKELGITYLHLMPIYRVPESENDGGYAVSSYREVNPAIGNIQELAELAGDLRKEHISLVLDLVFNHTSDEHDWTLNALSGDPDCQDYYLMFPDREIPDAYELYLREIFPDEHPGAFTYQEEIDQWVWTTFHTYQWDLNYANPAVFNNMVDEMLFLANLGVEVLRLDAVAFTWKKLGTNCENLPEAHILIQAFNAVARIASPALLFLSEAIVHPDEITKYIQPDECQLSYNPLQMALLWNSLATREVRLLGQALHERNNIPNGCAWVNYIRVHDDIGWTFSDEDAARLSINAFDHRQFLNSFYTGKFPGSFARGLPFQENLETLDARISGTAASLAGLEKALNEETAVEVDLAIRRILLLYGITLTTNGIPLIYLGDEVGTLNDYSYTEDPAKVDDSRWVHRPTTDWLKYKRRRNPNSIEGKIFIGLQELISLRKDNDVFTGIDLRQIDTDNQHVLGFSRQNEEQRVIILANFSEREQSVSPNVFRFYASREGFRDMVSGEKFSSKECILKPYQLICLWV